jgi:hypothetical protein
MVTGTIEGNMNLNGDLRALEDYRDHRISNLLEHLWIDQSSIGFD